MNRVPAIFSAATLALAGCATTPSFDLQGHRGTRGLAPENTLPAFARALAIGVTTLEMDAAITKDGVVVVSHNPALEANITRGPDGAWLAERGPLIHDLTYAELSRYDVGRIKPGTSYARDFPDQVPVDGTRIPKLSEVFDLVKASGARDVWFDIETKVSPLAPGDTLAPELFTRKLIAEIRAAGMASRTMIQSFDWRTLQIVQKEAPEIRTMYLSSSSTLASPRGRLSPWLDGFSPDLYGGSVPRAISAAGGKIWAPNQTYLTPAMLTEAHALGIVVIPWTVNEPAMMTKLIDMGVDGIISDRPDVVQIELKKLK